MLGRQRADRPALALEGSFATGSITHVVLIGTEIYFSALLSTDVYLQIPHLSSHNYY